VSIIIDDVPYPRATSYFVFPLLKVTTVVPMERKVAAQPMLSVMISA
jgi:hypothetical protein